MSLSQIAMLMSGVQLLLQTNGIALDSAGSIAITAPNGNTIVMDPATVRIQGNSYINHEHGGVQSGTSFTEPPNPN